MATLVKSFFFNVAPVAKGRPRFSRGGFAYTPKKTREFENRIKAELKEEWGDKDPLEIPLRVDFVFSLERPKSSKREWPAVRPDTDNYIKAVSDCLDKIVVKDDCYICEMNARKQYAAKASIEVHIYDLTKI